MMSEVFRYESFDVDAGLGLLTCRYSVDGRAFSERVTLESWQEGGKVPVEVEVEEARPMAPVPPADPPAAASR